MAINKMDNSISGQNEAAKMLVNIADLQCATHFEIPGICNSPGIGGIAYDPVGRKVNVAGVQCATGKVIAHKPRVTMAGIPLVTAGITRKREQIAYYQ